MVETPSADTLADGMATRVPDPDALGIIRRGASRIVTVTAFASVRTPREMRKGLVRR